MLLYYQNGERGLFIKEEEVAKVSFLNSTVKEGLLSSWCQQKTVAGRVKAPEVTYTNTLAEDKKGSVVWERNENSTSIFLWLKRKVGWPVAGSQYQNCCGFAVCEGLTPKLV